MSFGKIKLRTLLLTVFLCTIIVSSSLIIVFTYEKYSQSIHEHSLLTIDRAGDRMSEEIDCILEEVESVLPIGMLVYEHFPEIDEKNSTLILFFLSILRHDPHLFSYYLGQPDGKYLIAINLTFLPNTLSEFPAAPHDAAYVVLITASEGHPGNQIRSFYNRSFDLISTHTIRTDYDPRMRPWYTGAEQAKKLYWTDPYPHYYVQIESGLSAALPTYGKDGNLRAILGADLSINLFSHFLEQQNVSKNGMAFVVSSTGQILVPTDNPKRGKNLAEQAFKTFQQTKTPNFSFRLGKETYLASFHSFFQTNNKNWSILFIAPQSDFFSDLLGTQKEATYLSLAILAAASLLVVVLSFRISKPIVQIGDEIDRIARLDLESQTRIKSHIQEISRIDASIASMRTALRSFAHYIPKELAKRLMQKEHEIALGGEQKTISIFFTDIANFTAIAEANPVEEVNALLTEYFELLSHIITSCGGTIDKYIGDSIMSLWGAPDDLPDYAAHACTAALLCQHSLSALNAERKKQGQPLFETRMGIKTGPVIVGNFGTAERMNYSAVGDAVNTAARLQSMNKIYGTRIIVGQETIEAAGPQFLARPLEVAEIRGKKTPIPVFELMGKMGAEPEIEPTPAQKDLCARFTEAFRAFERHDAPAAKRLFQQILSLYPDDLPTKLFLEKL